MPPCRGVLGPNEYSELRVTYTPKHTGTFSSGAFALDMAGGNRPVLQLKGRACGPGVVLSTDCLSFGSLQAGKSSSKVRAWQRKRCMCGADGACACCC